MISGLLRDISHRPRFAGAIFFALLLLAGRPAAAEVDYYGVLEKLGDRAALPRLLSTEDAGMASVRPEALQPVEGDFDKDGAPDVAIAGVYNLPRKTGAYFLLVAGDTEGKTKLLYQEDSATPFYLHRPGTTGTGDPGYQAFSVTNCLNCEGGRDFFWDKNRRKFRPAVWKKNRTTAIAPAAAPSEPVVNVPDNVADQALRIAGELKDVQGYVGALSTGGGTLGTRVEAIRGSKNRVRVLIFEKVGADEKMYDTIEIDLRSEKIIRRQRT